MGAIFFCIKSWSRILRSNLDLQQFIQIVVFAIGLVVTVGTAEATTKWSVIAVDDILVVIPPSFSVPAGNPPIKPICNGPATKWAQFFCGYMTARQNPNNNYFISTNPDNSAWQIVWTPIYDSTGLLDHLESRSLVTVNYPNTQPYQAKLVFYMPWSKSFASSDPKFLAAQYGMGTKLSVASLGSSSISADKYDPTRGFDVDAFNVLAPLAIAYVNSGNPDYALQMGSGARANCFASCFFQQPDVASAGRVFVVYPVNSSGSRPPASEIPSLNDAAKQAVKYGGVFVNGSLNDLTEATANAQLMADKAGRPLVFMYYSKDVMGYFTVEVDAFKPRLQELGVLTDQLASKQGVKVTYYCHSYAAQECVTTLWSFNTAYIEGINPAYMNWNKTSYLVGLENMKGTYKCMQGTADVFLLIGYSGCAVWAKTAWEPSASWHGDPDVQSIVCSASMFPNVYNAGITQGQHELAQVTQFDSFWAQSSVQIRPEYGGHNPINNNCNTQY